MATQSVDKEITKTELDHSPHGLVLCNIGIGKGKTTAAIGTAVRASGAGLNVCVIQFVKARPPQPGEKKQPGEWGLSHEIRMLQNFHPDSSCGRIDCFQVGRGFVGILGDQKRMAEHIRAARDGLILAHDMISSGAYQLIVLDEIISAVELNLISEAAVTKLIKHKPEPVHLILTGHKSFPRILELCDTVTDMSLVKHPYYNGILAQKGIDY